MTYEYKIIGIDNSLNSPGVYLLCLDSTLNVIRSDYVSFTTTKKFSNENIFYYKKTDFEHYCNQYIWNRNKIIEKINLYTSKETYVAFEDYAFSAQGQTFTLAEATAALKIFFLEQKFKLRLYDPPTIKKFSTNYGNCDKIRMDEEFEKIDDDPFKPNLKFLKEFSNPKSDIIDAYFIAKLLLNELKIRKGILKLTDLTEKQIEIFNRTTKSYPENILVRPFIELVNNES